MWFKMMAFLSNALLSISLVASASLFRNSSIASSFGMKTVLAPFIASNMSSCFTISKNFPAPNSLASSSIGLVSAA
uniref:Putative secreted protein n=1 Tax=Panstrongylus lignarius TaxID=156445 RepID=A0A224XX45_9HEMI